MSTCKLSVIISHFTGKLHACTTPARLTTNCKLCLQTMMDVYNIQFLKESLWAQDVKQPQASGQGQGIKLVL